MSYLDNPEPDSYEDDPADKPHEGIKPREAWLLIAAIVVAFLGCCALLWFAITQAERLLQ